MDAITLNLPMPPSLNGTYYNRARKAPGGFKRRVALKGRGITPRYQAWLKEAGWACLTQTSRRIDGPVEIEISLSANMRGDLDNRVKATLDLLKRQYIIEDDNTKIVKKITVGLADISGARVTVTPVGSG